MPWDNNSGGGGRSGGPWGQSPGGGPRKSGGTPSLDDILNRGRNRFSGLPGGSRWGIVAAIAVVAALWLSQCIYTIEPQQVGVQLMFGRPLQQVSEPGLHFMLWPAETVRKVNVTENQSIIGDGPGGSDTEGLMLSGDQNIVDVRFSVLWQVNDPQNFLFSAKEPADMVRFAAESAMREVVGRRPVQDVFRDDRAGIAKDVQAITQGTLNAYQMGVQINGIAIENAAPPAEVADAFEEVQRAEQDQSRFQQEAQAYANTLLGNSRGQAAKMREDAAAYKDRVVKEAQGEAARFTSVYNAYVKEPDITRKRLYLETLQQILSDSQKVVIDKSASGAGVLPYLPLPALRSAPSTQGAGGAPSANDQISGGAAQSPTTGQSPASRTTLGPATGGSIAP